MAVSENSGFSPQIIHLIRVFHYKPSILGCFPIFGNTHMYTPEILHRYHNWWFGKSVPRFNYGVIFGYPWSVSFRVYIYMFTRHNKIPSGFSCEIVFVGSCYMFRKQSNTHIWICMSCINKNQHNSGHDDLRRVEILEAHYAPEMSSSFVSPTYFFVGETQLWSHVLFSIRIVQQDTN